MKKKLFLMLILCGAVSLVGAQDNKYVIKGKVKNCADTKVSATIWKGDETTYADVAMDKGSFVMEGESAEPIMIRISFSNRETYKYVGDGYIPYKCSSMWMLGYPGAKATVNGKLTDFVEAYPSGDKENEILAKLTKTIYPMMNKCGNIRVKLETDKSLTAEQRKALSNEHDRIDGEMMAAMHNFMEKYVSSYAGLWFLSDMMMRKQVTPEQAKQYLSLVKDSKYTDLEWYKLIKKRTESTQFSVGNKLPSLKSKNTPDGKEFSLESLKGKFVIIDFWGTWCGPCMAGMPHMKSFRDENASKLEIISIAKDKREVWLSELKRNSYNWVHLLNGLGDEDFVSKFNISGYPTKILIGPDGTILHRESGESNAFYDKVREFMK